MVEIPQLVGYGFMNYCLIIFANENLSFCNSRMDKILSNSITGWHYMLQPGPQELERGILKYDPDLHAHLWTYVTIEGQVYTNNPELVDWDSGVDEWKEEVMGQWPFGCLLYTSPSPRDATLSRMPSSA